MSLFGSALLAAAHLRWKRLDAHGKRPRAVQEAALLELVRRARDTEFGRAHRFERIRNLSDFRQRVPVRRYADLKGYLERAKQGEPNVVWPGKIRYFGMSSGTTGGNKYLPISAASIRAQQRGGFDPLASYLRWTGDRELLSGKAIMLGGSAALEQHPNGILVGDNTGIMARHMPRLVQRQYHPSRRVRFIDDWDTKIAELCRECLDQDVRLLAGTPSWFPGVFDRLLLEAHAAGKRAGSVFDVWPNLRLLTGGGINYEPYRPQIEARLGRRVPYVDVYNATEGGIMGVQDEQHESPMRLIVDGGVFFELVPVDELERPEPRRLAVWEAELGVSYALVVSTMSGLFGYVIGDCVRFDQLFPHRFHFEGRVTAFLNTTGEHVSQGELERAVTRACQSVGCELGDFTVLPRVTERGARHVYLMEFRKTPSELAQLAKLIDVDIAAQNGDYSAHRSSQVGLAAPIVEPVASGTFHDFMQARGKLGGQHKVPRVLTSAADSDWFERVLRARSSALSP